MGFVQFVVLAIVAAGIWSNIEHFRIGGFGGLGILVFLGIPGAIFSINTLVVAASTAPNTNPWPFVLLLAVITGISIALIPVRERAQERAQSLRYARAVQAQAQYQYDVDAYRRQIEEG